MNHHRTLLIVYHSHTGGTQQMVEAVRAGAALEPLVQTRILHASETMLSDVLQAHAYVFATPENLAAISGLMKDFFDRCYYGALDHIQGRPYATLVCAGSDGSHAVQQIARIATGWRLKPVAEPVIVCTHAQTPQAIAAPKQISPTALQTCQDLGHAMASGLALGIY